MRRIAITAGELALEPDENSFTLTVHALAARAAELAADGVEIVLVREKALPAAALRRLVQQIVDAVRGTQTQVIVAGPYALDAAQRAEAHGVHLGSLAPSAEAGGRVERVKAVWPRALITVSCHTRAEVAHAVALPLAAILFAPVFGKTVAGQVVVPGLGLDVLRQACAAADGMDVFALGGVTEANAHSCVQAGAAGVAAIRMFRWPALSRIP